MYKWTNDYKVRRENYLCVKEKIMVRVGRPRPLGRAMILFTQIYFYKIYFYRDKIYKHDL